MDRIEKALKKLNERDRRRIKEILEHIAAGDFFGIDIQKLRGYDDLYRARIRDLRVIFRVSRGGKKYLLAIERRRETTYRHFRY